jgi:hypothetical protein
MAASIVLLVEDGVSIQKVIRTKSTIHLDPYTTLTFFLFTFYKNELELDHQQRL